MNIESHSLLQLLDPTPLEQILDAPMPVDAMPPKVYGGNGRIIVPTVRTTQDKGEALALRALLLAKEACNAVTVTYKPLGSPAQLAQTVKLTKIAREVYQGAIPAQKTSFEYSIAADCGAEKLAFPSGAPTIMQSVVVM